MPRDCVFGRPPYAEDDLPRVPKERDEAEHLELQFREWCREITDELIEKQTENRSAATVAERDSSLVYDLQFLEKTTARVEELQLRSTHNKKLRQSKHDMQNQEGSAHNTFKMGKS